MHDAFVIGFILVALGFAAGIRTRRSQPAPLQAPHPAPRRRPRGLPAILIGAGAVILGGGLALWLGISLLALADSASFDLTTLTRGLGAAALGGVAVGLAAGFAAPGSRRWAWGLLASLLPWLLAVALWVFLLAAPEAFEATQAYAQERGVAVGEVRRSIFQLLAIVTAYPLVTLLGVTGGVTVARVLSSGRRNGASARERPPSPGVDEKLRLDEEHAWSGQQAPGADEAPDVQRDDVAAFRLARVGESWCHRVFDGPQEVAFLEVLPVPREGGFELEGTYYKITADLLGRSHTLEWRGRPLATADVGLFRRSSRILFGDRELWLRPRAALAPVPGAILLEESGSPTGRVEPSPIHGEDGVAELPPELPLPVRLFVIYVALVILMRWRRSGV